MKGIIDAKKKQCLAMFFPNGLCLLAACCSSIKKGFLDLVLAEKKPCCFEMPAFWAMLQAGPLALSGDQAFKWVFVSNVLWLAWWQHGPAVCLEMGHCAWLSEAVSSSAMLNWMGQEGTAVFSPSNGAA